MRRNRGDYDFAGWATKNNILCSDGRTILPNAFIQNDGKKVPLVWNHQHNDPENILGHAYLENRKEGVYFYGTFNNSTKGQAAKDLVKCGDIDAVSIFAGGLQHVNGRNVQHGDIKELSLVISGANKGATIQEVLCHSDMEDDTEAIFQNFAPNFYVKDSVDEETLRHFEEVLGENEEDEPMDGEDINSVLDTLTPEQQEAVGALLEHAVDQTVADTMDALANDYDEDDDYEPDEDDDYEPDEDDDYEEDEDMRHNAFDEYYNGEQEGFLSHSDEMEIINRAISSKGSLKQAFADFTGDAGTMLMHADDDITRSYKMPDGSTREYFVRGLNQLFPDAHLTSNVPELITRDQTWVNKVIAGVKNLPFSRVKTLWADVTEEGARALGYQTGKYKKEEVFSLLKRTTQPTTIYKKQKIDRDDRLDITGFDVVAWIKEEMRIMLKEEIARAILLGDGRAANSDDKVNEQCIVPIVKDIKSGVFGIPVKAKYAWEATDDEETIAGIRARNFIRTVKKNRKKYKGSGNPVLFCSEDLLTDMLMLEDGIGRPLYDTIEKLKTALRVSDIIPVELMENFTSTFPVDDASGEFDFTSDSTVTKPVLGIFLNLIDYGVGKDRQGETNFFSDFDIDYNQEKYLIETRMSGALRKPKSALIFADYGAQKVASDD